MNKKLLLNFLLIFTAIQLSARPTVQVSNLYYTRVGCTGAVLKWTKGNGISRVIIGHKGSAPNYAPVDGFDYNSFNPNFGNSVPYGSQNYFVYKGATNDSITLIGLEPGQDYYFTAYEYDLGSGGTEYLISSAPTVNFTLYQTSNHVSVIALDSCVRSNEFIFTNNSTSNVPDITYRLKTPWADTPFAVSSQVSLRMVNSGVVDYYIYNYSGYIGCQNSVKSSIRVFPAKFVSIDLSKGTDTVQDFIDNYFEYTPSVITAPFPMSINYNWNYGDNTGSQNFRMKKSYNNTGYYNVTLILNALTHNKPTACFDTINFHVHVRYNPYELISVSPKFQYEDSNKIYFSMIDPNLTYSSWKFGDGDSSLKAGDTHIYKNPGIYNVTLNFTLSSGKKGLYKDTVEIVPFSSVNSIDKNNGFKIYPNPFQNILYFNFDIKIGSDVKIYSTDGRLIKTIWIIEENAGIDLSDMSEEHFIIQVTSPDGTLITMPFYKVN